MATKTEQRRHVNAWIDPDLARRLDEKRETLTDREVRRSDLR
jgi:hypothetical protein